MPFPAKTVVVHDMDNTQETVYVVFCKQRKPLILEKRKKQGFSG
jgi:hypothetical protein